MKARSLLVILLLAGCVSASPTRRRISGRGVLRIWSGNATLSNTVRWGNTA